jgi:hypothetical protein
MNGDTGWMRNVRPVFTLSAFGQADFPHRVKKTCQRWD